MQIILVAMLTQSSAKLKLHECSPCVYCSKVLNEISTVLGHIESTDAIFSCFTLPHNKGEH